MKRLSVFAVSFVLFLLAINAQPVYAQPGGDGANSPGMPRRLPTGLDTYFWYNVYPVRYATSVPHLPALSTDTVSVTILQGGVPIVHKPTFTCAEQLYQWDWERNAQGQVIMELQPNGTTKPKGMVLAIDKGINEKNKFTDTNWCPGPYQTYDSIVHDIRLDEYPGCGFSVQFVIRRCPNGAIKIQIVRFLVPGASYNLNDSCYKFTTDYNNARTLYNNVHNFVAKLEYKLFAKIITQIAKDQAVSNQHDVCLNSVTKVSSSCGYTVVYKSFPGLLADNVVLDPKWIPHAYGDSFAIQQTGYLFQTYPCGTACCLRRFNVCYHYLTGQTTISDTTITIDSTGTIVNGCQIVWSYPSNSSGDTTWIHTVWPGVRDSLGVVVYDTTSNLPPGAQIWQISPCGDRCIATTGDPGERNRFPEIDLTQNQGESKKSNPMLPTVNKEVIVHGRKRR